MAECPLPHSNGAARLVAKSQLWFLKITRITDDPIKFVYLWKSWIRLLKDVLWMRAVTLRCFKTLKAFEKVWKDLERSEKIEKLLQRFENWKTIPHRMAKANTEARERRSVAKPSNQRDRLFWELIKKSSHNWMLFQHVRFFIRLGERYTKGETSFN